MSASDVAAQSCSFTLHLLVGVCIFRVTAPVPLRAPTGATAQKLEVFAAAPPLPQLPGLNPIDAGQDESAIRRPEESPVVSLPGFKYDFSKVALRATLLFPFLTPGLALDQIVPGERREIMASFRDPDAPAPSRRHGGREKPPLVLGTAALQALIDRCWSRRDRWSVFEPLIALAGTYNPDTGDLPAALHRYVQENGLQPYVDATIRDARMWVELGLAADHVDFIGFISRYASEHPATKATIELLFLLDKLAQGSLDALVTLLDIEPAKDLEWTRRVNGDAFRWLAEIRRYYQAQLERRGLDSAVALRQYYSRVRLAILTRILRTTPHGYRSSDARFLIGAVHWREGHVIDALQSWRDLAVDPSDAYVTVYSDILAAVRDSSGGNRQDVDSARVDRILKSEHGRWLIASIDRLRRFGYHLDTF